jgi:hypothetical protein
MRIIAILLLCVASFSSFSTGDTAGRGLLRCACIQPIWLARRAGNNTSQDNPESSICNLYILTLTVYSSSTLLIARSFHLLPFCQSPFLPHVHLRAVYTPLPPTWSPIQRNSDSSLHVAVYALGKGVRSLSNGCLCR